MAKGIGLGVFVLLVIGGVIGYAYLQHLGTAGGDPNFFESDILDFEAADRASPPEPGAIVFVGSSSIRLWTSLAEDFAPLPVLNRGFGGAHMDHVLHYYDRVIAPYAARATKQTLNKILKKQAEDVLDIGLGWEYLSMKLADHHEAASAFVEKRDATFTGS